MSDFEIIDGEFYTGLLTQSKRPQTYAAYSTAQPVLSMAEIRKLLANPDRTPARVRFPSSLWIRSQGRRGSCNGYAGAWALARARVNAGLPFVPLSGEYLYALINGGRDAGSNLDAGMKAIQTKGVARENLVKHESYLFRDMSAEAREDAANHMGFECYSANDPIELASGLAFGFVGVVAVHASGAYRGLDSRGVRGASRGPGNHAVGVQDVRINPGGELEYDEFGSWGRGNGQDGCAWLTWDRHLEPTSPHHEFYLIRAASDARQSDVPRVKL